MPYSSKDIACFQFANNHLMNAYLSLRQDFICRNWISLDSVPALPLSDMNHGAVVQIIHVVRSLPPSLMCTGGVESIKLPSPPLQQANLSYFLQAWTAVSYILHYCEHGTSRRGMEISIVIDNSVSEKRNERKIS